MQWFAHHRIAVLGTLSILAVSWISHYFYRALLEHTVNDSKERFDAEALSVPCSLCVLPQRLCCFGPVCWNIQEPSLAVLAGQVLAIALREPLLSIAGRIAILTGHMFSVGDRIQINNMSGDVIDVGMFYTRMMEIGNWIQADQVTDAFSRFRTHRCSAPPSSITRRSFSSGMRLSCPSPIRAISNGLHRFFERLAASTLANSLPEHNRNWNKCGNIFLLPVMEIQPEVFLKVTDNWLELSMRMQQILKSAASPQISFLQRCSSESGEHDDIQIASSTMDLTTRKPPSG